MKQCTEIVAIELNFPEFSTNCVAYYDSSMKLYSNTFRERTHDEVEIFTNP